MPSAVPVHQRRAHPDRPLRLLHTSDVHLESDTFGHGEQGRKLRDSIRGAFSQVVSTANRLQADMLLIVGDLFDSSRITDEALSFALSQIARAKMPVVMTPGNHDAHDERSIWVKLPPSEMPRNLHMLLEPEGSTLDFPELQTRVWGRALIEHTPDYRPLAGIAPAVDGLWNIALAHGFFMEEGEFDRSSPINPVDIEGSGYDYIALGHIHVFTDCSRGATRAAYCGTPAPLYQEAGWVAHVRFEPGVGIELERLAVAVSE
ncbi:MAG TPA: DNA repair exonuclease [Candidatus Binataceae bacterium]|jgi:exonuclease SbcD|nr:DNA repair exonuclease [Candidatus Binataceae bacterium]